MSQLIRRGVLTAFSAAAVLGLAACSFATGAPGDSRKATGGHTSAAAIPTGRALNSMLLPVRTMPSGFKADPDSVRNTGDHDAAATPDPIPAAKKCDALTSTSWINTAGITGVSFAQNDYTKGDYNLIGQEIDGFPGSEARTVMSRLRRVFAGCAHFTTHQAGAAYQQSLLVKSLPGVGDESLEGVVTSPAFEGGTTIIAVRVGNLIVTTLDTSQNDSGSALVPLTETLVGKVTAAHH
jgi:hypothetical protein